MASCLMFLSRCVAFFQPWMGCVHSHCLRSKIEGKPCKLWMPPHQRHNTAKTICVDMPFAPVKLCVSMLDALLRPHVKQKNNAEKRVENIIFWKKYHISSNRGAGRKTLCLLERTGTCYFFLHQLDNFYKQELHVQWLKWWRCRLRLLKFGNIHVFV